MVLGFGSRFSSSKSSNDPKLSLLVDPPTRSSQQHQQQQPQTTTATAPNDSTTSHPLLRHKRITTSPLHILSSSSPANTSPLRDSVDIHSLASTDSNNDNNNNNTNTTNTARSSSSSPPFHSSTVTDSSFLDNDNNTTDRDSTSSFSSPPPTTTSTSQNLFQLTGRVVLALPKRITDALSLHLSFTGRVCLDVPGLLGDSATTTPLLKDPSDHRKRESTNPLAAALKSPPRRSSFTDVDALLAAGTGRSSALDAATRNVRDKGVRNLINEEIILWSCISGPTTPDQERSNLNDDDQLGIGILEAATHEFPFSLPLDCDALPASIEVPFAKVEYALTASFRRAGDVPDLIVSTPVTLSRRKRTTTGLSSSVANSVSNLPAALSGIGGTGSHSNSRRASGNFSSGATIGASQANLSTGSGGGAVAGGLGLGGISGSGAAKVIMSRTPSGLFDYTLSIPKEGNLNKGTLKVLIQITVVEGAKVDSVRAVTAFMEERRVYTMSKED
ncbi:hypothetical protein HK102_006242, partial [Quaeritorhiza haematococci]